MSTFAFLVTVSAPNGEQLFSTIERAAAEGILGSATSSGFVLAGRYEERLIAQPRIRKSVAMPGDGIQKVDDVTVELANTDGGLNDWFTTNDPRDKAMRIYELDIDSGIEPVLLWDGVVGAISVAINDRGIATVRVTGDSQSVGALQTLIPPVVDPSTFGVVVSEQVAEDFGLAIPAVIGGTREHVRCPFIRKAPSADRYEYVAMHDPAVEGTLCSGRVNTVYVQDADGRVRVLPATEWTQSKTSHPGYVTIKSFRARTGPVLADMESTEFDSLRQNMRAHWLFRESLADELSSHPLTFSGALGEWQFMGSLADSSGNNHTLVYLSGDTTVHYADEGSESPGALHNKFLSTEQTRFTAGLATDFDFDATTSFRIVATVATEDNFNTIDGNICAKQFGPELGYQLLVIGGFPQFTMLGSGGGTGVTLNGTTFIGDGAFHRVEVIVNRTQKTAILNVDGSFQDLADISTQGTISNTNRILTVAGQAGGGAALFTGKLGYLAIFNTLGSSDVTYTEGHSRQSKSAISIPLNTQLQVAHDSVFNVGPSDDLVIVAWIKTTGIGFIIAKAATSGFTLVVISGGTIRLQLFDGTNTPTVITTSAFNDGEWHEIHAVLDRSISKAMIYVDGILASPQVDTSSLGSLVTSTSVVVFDDANNTDTIEIDEIALMMGGGVALTSDQVRTQYMTATGNAARSVRRLLNATQWGLGQAVNASSFDAAEDEIATRKILFDGALAQQRSAEDWLTELLRAFGMVLKRRSAEWIIEFSWKGGATTWKFGFDDGRLDNVASVTSFERRPTDSMPKTLAVRYHPTVGAVDQADRLLAQTDARTVRSNGEEERVVEFPLVRRWETADRIAHFLSEWAKSDLTITFDAGSENRLVGNGDAVEVSVQLLGLSSAAYRASSIERNSDVVSVEAYQDSPAALVYVATNEVTAPVPDSAPDFRNTPPPPPTGLHLTVNQLVGSLAVVRVQFVMPTGQQADEIVEGYRVRFRVQDSNNDQFEWTTGDESATSGQTRTWTGRFVTAFQGLTLELGVSAIDTNGRESSQAITVAQGLTVAADAGKQTLVFTIAS